MNPLFLVPLTAFLLLFLLTLRKLFMRPNDAISREYECGETNEFLLSEHAWVPEGAAVGFTTAGYARSLQAGDRFVGFCQDTADNTGGGNGDQRVRVQHSGKIKLWIDGLTRTQVGQAVFASDSDTFTLTGEPQSRIGVVYRVESEGVGIVAFNASFYP